MQYTAGWINSCIGDIFNNIKDKTFYPDARINNWFVFLIKKVFFLCFLKQTLVEPTKIIMISHYSGTSIFDLLHIQTIRFSTKKFELKVLPNSNRTSVFEHSRWEPKRAEWSRNTIHSISRERKEPRGAETHSADRFLIKRKGFLLKRKGRLLPSQIHLQRREREEKKTLKESYPASFRSLMLFRYTFS